jgi:hypothetical protein
MTRLDQNRGRAQIAERLKVNVGKVNNVIIWGNHSATQVPDANSATVDLGSGPVPVAEALKNDEWLKGEFITVSRYWLYCILVGRNTMELVRKMGTSFWGNLLPPVSGKQSAQNHIT